MRTTYTTAICCIGIRDKIGVYVCVYVAVECCCVKSKEIIVIFTRINS